MILKIYYDILIIIYIYKVFKFEFFFGIIFGFPCGATMPCGFRGWGIDLPRRQGRGMGQGRGDEAGKAQSVPALSHCHP